MEDDKVERALEAWKVTVQVQQHFNDIEMKIRNYALTLLLAVAAGVGVALRDGEKGLALMLVGAGFVVWLLFYLMDEFWYHRLLIGAVENGLALELELARHVPGIGLTQHIKDESALSVGGKKIRSHLKIRYFYGAVAVMMVLAFGLIGGFV